MKQSTQLLWINRSLRLAKPLWLALIALAGTSACTSFQGPGDLKVGAEPTAAAEVSQEAEDSSLPVITWNGERHTEAPQAKIRFDWPVDDARLTRGFLTNRRRAHWGLDLANRRGTPILASEKGTVIYTGNAFRGYGKLIVIEHNNEWATLYSHLDKITVKEGDVVDKGSQIGLMGRTGRATGVHLHFEIRQHRQPVNPLAYLPQFPGASELAEQTLPGASSRRVTSRERRSERR